MDKKTIILIVIAILVIALAALGLYIANTESGNNPLSLNATNIIKNTDDANTTDNATIEVEDNSTNVTVVGDDSPRENATNNNTTYKVYNPQTDSYVPVIGEKYDDEVNRWYTYDTDGVRYYNTRINTN